jgi:putative two-component system response regulator
MFENVQAHQTLHEAQILIADDQEANVRLLEEILTGVGYTRLVSTIDSREIVHLFTQVQPDIVLLDLMMPDPNGFEVMRQLKLLAPSGNYCPILVLTADVSKESKREALRMGASDFLTKPFDSTEVLLRIKNLLETRFLHLQLEDKVRERTQELQNAQVEILKRLARAAEYRDDHTGQHTERVGHLSALLAGVLGLPHDRVELIRLAAPLHDIGKIAIGDNILLKPGKLTPDEFEVMKTHTTIGAAILSRGRSELVKMAEEIALVHHERWDGTGYPRGLKGDGIPIEGRIVALADVFDALTHERPYKRAWPVEEAIAEIRKESGKRFDPQIVRAFIERCKVDAH